MPILFCFKIKLNENFHNLCNISQVSQRTNCFAGTARETKTPHCAGQTQGKRKRTAKWGDISGHFCCQSWEATTRGQAPRGQQRQRQAPGWHGLAAPIPDGEGLQECSSTPELVSPGEKGCALHTGLQTPRNHLCTAVCAELPLQLPAFHPSHD